MSGYDTALDLSGENRTEVIVLGVISTISTVSVFLLLLHLFITSFLSGKGKDNDERILLRTHFGAFVVFLFISDLTQGLAGMIELGWASKAQITPGSLCTAQGVMLQIGDVGTAVWNAIIAIHTFWAVVLGRKMTVRGAASLTVIGWATCLLLTTIGPLAIQTPDRGPFYGVSNAWCFITAPYARQRTLLHYLPMLLSALTITVLYVLVALVLFRVLIVHGNTWRFEAPTRKTGSIVRDFFGQFSWGRLYHHSESITTHSAGITQRPNASLTGPPNGALGYGWEISSQLPGNRNANGPDISQAEMSEFENPISTMSVRLRKLAIKMLWYPSVYLVLILPITISRIDESITVSLSVLLGFTCMLLFMGTANTIIFAFTRRLGPAPWARRVLHSQGKAERGKVRPTPSQGSISLQIQIERYTQPGIEDRSIDLPRKKSLASILTGITTVSSTPLTLDHRFESPMGTTMGNVPSPSSSSDPHVFGAHPFHPHPPERRDQYSPYPFALPDPPAQQKEQEQPQGWVYPHPYSRALFP